MKGVPRIGVFVEEDITRNYSFKCKQRICYCASANCQGFIGKKYTKNSSKRQENKKVFKIFKIKIISFRIDIATLSINITTFINSR